jgi:hypothetical protein
VREITEGSFDAQCRAAFEEQFKEIDPSGAKREAYRRACGRNANSTFELECWLLFGGADLDHATPDAVVEASPTSSSDPFATREQRLAAITATKMSERQLARTMKVTRSALNTWKNHDRKDLGGRSARVDRIEGFLRKVLAETMRNNLSD